MTPALSAKKQKASDSGTNKLFFKILRANSHKNSLL